MICAYLTFNGNCRQAMTFYQQCLGGELMFQTVAESPLSDDMPKRMKELIVHAELNSNQLLLMASDMAPDTGLIRGNAVSLLLSSENESELSNWFQKLSEGGEITQKLQESYFGVLFGGITDKFGNYWLFNHTKNTPEN